MATALSNVIPSCASDTDYRAWCQHIDDQLEAMGWEKETVSGEIDLTTVTVPEVFDNVDFNGFQIWRLADTLQSTHPFFMKLEYGAQGNWESSGSPAIRVQFATGHSGATLTGNMSQQKILAAGNRSDNPMKCVWSGDTNRLAFALFYDLSSGWMWMAVERTYDSEGDTGNALCIYGASPYAGQRWQMVVPSTGNVPASETDLGCIAPTVGSGVRGVEVALYRVTPFLGKSLQPSQNIFGYFDADISAETVVECDVDGAAVDVFVVGNQAYPIARGNTATRLAIRYE